MKKIIRFEVILILVLLAINLVPVFLNAWGETYAQRVDRIQQIAPPEGQKYEIYCDGRPSDILVDNNEEGCIADYPGVFATAVLGGFSIVIFILGTVLIGVWGMVFAAGTDRSD